MTKTEKRDREGERNNLGGGRREGGREGGREKGREESRERGRERRKERERERETDECKNLSGLEKSTLQKAVLKLR